MPHQIPLLHPGSDNVCLKMGEGQGHRTILKTMVSGLGSDINDSTPTFLSKVKVLSRTSRNIAGQNDPFRLRKSGLTHLRIFASLDLPFFPHKHDQDKELKSAKYEALRSNDFERYS
jgi:hypothetical protein